MTQKHLVILILLIIIIGLVVSGLGFVKSNFQASLNPDPTPAQDTESMNEQNQTNPESLSVQGQSSSSLSGVVKEPSPPSQKPKKTYSQPPKELPTNQILNQKAVIETDRGIIEFEFYPEATKAASNFIFLAKDGFYDGLTFHRIEPGFVIQGGDPLGNGQGGPGYTFADEPVSRAYTKGVVAMANRGPDTNGSQFFIVLANTQLPPKYTIFGNVIQGKEILDNIKIGDVMRRVSIQPLVKN